VRIVARRMVPFASEMSCGAEMADAPEAIAAL
jgi:hypothetical protein